MRTSRYAHLSSGAKGTVEMVGAGGVDGRAGADAKGAGDSGAADGGFVEVAGAVVVAKPRVSPQNLKVSSEGQAPHMTTEERRKLTIPSQRK